MEMKEPNEKECLVHSRDKRERKMSPAWLEGGDGTGASKFRRIARKVEEARFCPGPERSRSL